MGGNWPRRVIGMLAVLTMAAFVLSCQPSAPTQAAAPPAATNLFLMVDTVQGSTNVPKDQAAARSCVLSSRYPRNSQIVWRARVFDPKTGDLMDDKALSSVQVALGNGKTINMKFGSHPKDPPGEAYWTGSWIVPKDNATGTLKYTVTATAADSRTGLFEPFSIASSQLAITDEVMPDAPAK
jgi:hypothetical protein